MWIATWHTHYVSGSEGFDNEPEAERWLEAEMRSKGAKHGVVYEIEGGA